MRIESEEHAKDLFFDLVNNKDKYREFDASNLEFGDWYKLQVYLPNPPEDSSITPPFMEAFLEIQKHIYQLAALSKSGVANANYISEDERRELDLAVVVKGGSSDLYADIREVVMKSIPQAVTKMSGRQIAIVVLGIALITATAWGTSSFLEMQKEIKLAELKSSEHISTIEKLSFASAQQVETLKVVLGAMKESGEVGKKAADLTTSSQEALLKAASKTNGSVINDVHVGQDEAKALRTSPRNKADIVFAIKNVRVTDINTDDPTTMVVTLKEQDGDDEYKIKFADRLLEVTDRETVFSSHGKRESIWVELRIKSVDNEVRSVELKRVVPPNDLAHLLEE